MVNPLIWGRSGGKKKRRNSHIPGGDLLKSISRHFYHLFFSREGPLNFLCPPQIINGLATSCLLHWSPEVITWIYLTTLSWEARVSFGLWVLTFDECCGKIDLFRVQNRAVSIPSWWNCCLVKKYEITNSLIRMIINKMTALVEHQP